VEHDARQALSAVETRYRHGVPLTVDQDRPPVPPADLILRVACSFDAGDVEAAKRGFDAGGLESLRRFEGALGAVGRRFEDARRMLDFGCGCGRFLRHLRPLAQSVELHGTDIDREMIEWCSAHIPYASFTVGAELPPLPYPDGQFDLVINHSVLTHLDERHQDLWLGELRRITSEGAIVMLTVEGPSTWARTVSHAEAAGEDVERWREELECRGILYIAEDQLIGSTHPESYHSAIHAPWYVFEHWSRWFDIAAYIPEGAISQDLVVLRHRAQDAAAVPPIPRRPPASARPPAPARAELGALARRLLERTAHGGGAPCPDTERLERELNMTRVGLYEQGKRISVVAAELRAEIAELRDRLAGDGA
jgi:SAM-dependent methyltransferase